MCRTAPQIDMWDPRFEEVIIPQPFSFSCMRHPSRDGATVSSSEPMPPPLPLVPLEYPSTSSSLIAGKATTSPPLSPTLSLSDLTPPPPPPCYPLPLGSLARRSAPLSFTTSPECASVGARPPEPPLSPALAGSVSRAPPPRSTTSTGLRPWPMASRGIWRPGLHRLWRHGLRRLSTASVTMTRGRGSWGFG